MLAKVKGVQWCSNAVKLHDNEPSSSFSLPRIKEKYHLHEDKKKKIRKSLQGHCSFKAVQSSRNNCTATIACSVYIKGVRPLFQR